MALPFFPFFSVLGTVLVKTPAFHADMVASWSRSDPDRVHLEEFSSSFSLASPSALQKLQKVCMGGVNHPPDLLAFATSAFSLELSSIF